MWVLGTDGWNIILWGVQRKPQEESEIHVNT
jgi:hypothetical protein